MSTNPIAVGAALAWAKKEFGGNVIAQDSVVVVPTAAAQILAGNPDRVGLLFMNIGSVAVNVGLTAAVGGNNGILLVSGGGSVTMNVRDDFTLQSFAWFGSSGGGGNVNVYVIEVNRFSL